MLSVCNKKLYLSKKKALIKSAFNKEPMAEAVTLINNLPDSNDDIRASLVELLKFSYEIGFIDGERFLTEVFVEI